jgi:iron complex transport system ATP-binding protein
MTKNVITIENLHFSYDKTPVLSDLSFCVENNAFFIIIGPNGSGKSTLLKIIAGIVQPSAGHIHIHEKSISEYPKKSLAKTISWVPQMTSVDFPFTVRDVVLMGRAPHLGLLGLENKTDILKAMEALEFTGVAHLAGRNINHLSGGEQQRVFIARAICQDTEILLLDEPTASLDLAHQVRIMDLMEKLKAEKQTTIVMVSHDINLAAMYGDVLLLISKGKIVQSGPPTQVITFQTLEETYGCTLLVDESPLGQYPRITQVPGKHLKEELKIKSEQDAPHR